MKTQFFSLGKLYQKYDLRNTLITLVIIHTMFGLIWTIPWPDEKDLFLKFLFRALQKLRMEYQFFCRQFIPKVLFALRFHYTGDTSYQV